MAERFVLVTVRVATEGTRCGDACPYLKPFDELTAPEDAPDEPHRCLLFLADVRTHWDALDFCRVEECLALDGGGAGEPNGVGDGPASPHRRRRRGTTTGLPWPGVRAPP